MENDPAPEETPQQVRLPQTSRDPLIRYSVFAALGCAGVCILFAIIYIFGYSLSATLSFEHHFNDYLSTSHTANLSTVLGLHMAQNRMFLQSCGIIAGIFFACIGLALFLVGFHGSIDAQGRMRDGAAGIQRLAPGAIVLLIAMIFVGVAAMHPIDLVPTPVGSAPTATPSHADPPASPSADPAPLPLARPRQTQALATPASPSASPLISSRPQPSVRQQAVDPAPRPSSPSAASPAAHPTPAAPTPQAWPATATAQHPAPRPAAATAGQDPPSIPPLHPFVP